MGELKTSVAHEGYILLSFIIKKMRIPEANKKFALIYAALFTFTIVIGKGSITSVVYAQVEEQEGNLAGKVAKLQVVIDTCDQKIRDGGPVWEWVKDDCFKVVDSFNLVMSEALKNNSVSIDNIFYGNKQNLTNP
jgi:hypothetical protein